MSSFRLVARKIAYCAMPKKHPILFSFSKPNGSLCLSAKLCTHNVGMEDIDIPCLFAAELCPKLILLLEPTVLCNATAPHSLGLRGPLLPYWRGSLYTSHGCYISRVLQSHPVDWLLPPLLSLPRALHHLGLVALADGGQVAVEELVVPGSDMLEIVIDADHGGHARILRLPCVALVHGR